MDHLDLFTDGGAMKIGNNFYGSSAYVIRFKNKYFVRTNPVVEGTNNYFELVCIRDGLREILNGWSHLNEMELWIISDSQYSISCITEWFTGWKREKAKYYNKSGKEVANTVISKEYPSEWVKGDEPYYPVNDQKNLDLYNQYKRINGVRGRDARERNQNIVKREFDKINN